ncbi:MAG: metal-dependent hydrolase [Bacillota bacterium]
MGYNRLRWLGHSAFEISTVGDKKILIDPWITGNPKCPVTIDEIEDVDIILITHDHGDHIGQDLPTLASRGNVDIVGQPEILQKLQEMDVEDGTGMNIGGTATVQGIDITMVQAHHSSGYGTPCGYLVKTEDDNIVYHAGDTGIFATMEILGDIYDIDVALLPIGSHFVMDPVQAAYAVSLLEPKIVTPMHYGTFPVLVESADEFVELVLQTSPEVDVRVMKPGRYMDF